MEYIRFLAHGKRSRTNTDVYTDTHKEMHVYFTKQEPHTIAYPERDVIFAIGKTSGRQKQRRVMNEDAVR